LFPHLTTTVLHANGFKARAKLLDTDSDIYVINHDGVGVFCDKVPGRYGSIKLVLKPVLAGRADIDVVLIDELGMLRNAQTHRWKAMEALIKGRPRVWGMTGGPIPHSPTDAWAQIRLLTPSQVPSAFTRFREEIMFQAGPWGWKPKPEALDRIWEVMRPAVRFTRDQCLDLPPTTYSERVAPLTVEQEKAYKEMTQVSAIFHQGQHITAFNAAIKANKCLQAACGMMIGNDGVTVRFDNKPRLNLLVDLIDQAAAKVIVFVPFKDALRQVAEHVAKDYTVDTVSGDTPKHERDRIFTDFQQQENPHVIVAHPKVMAHGLTLTQADTIIWYAVMPDLDIYDQACGRITRVNQTRRTHIIHIVSTQVERKIANTLQRRGNIQAALLEMYKTETNLKGV
jgi:SNF2 family DNA or RNA helicase